MNLTKFINRGNVKANLPKGQYAAEGSPNIKVPELGDWNSTFQRYNTQELTPFQAAILNNFIVHSGYSGYDTLEILNKFGIRGMVSAAIEEGSDFTPILRDALKNDSVALAAFDESLKQATNYENIFKAMNASEAELAEVMNANKIEQAIAMNANKIELAKAMNASKAELAKAKAMEKQAAALNKIKKQTEQANRNIQFIEKYGKPYNRFNASKEYIKDVLWRGDKSIYNSIKNIKDINQPAKLITLNTLNAASPIIWNTPIFEKIFGDRSPKEWGQAGQVATTGYLANRYLGGVSKKAAILAAALQALGSLGASSYFGQNQNKPNNTENQEKLIEKLIENKLNERNNTESQEKPIEKYKGW